MITRFVIFAFFIGLLTFPVIAAAVIWTIDKGIRMNWWKWTLVAVWYFLLLFFILLDFTFIGEGEPAAGWKGLLFQLLIMIILGVGLSRIIFAKR
ncbi:hypothetical protein ES705_35623 [subsurface metagenome]